MNDTSSEYCRVGQCRALGRSTSDRTGSDYQPGGGRDIHRPFLREALRFRGGTALNKLHFPAPLRYSEDIDLVRTEAGPIGPVLDALRVVLEPWLGHGQYESSPVAPKLKFRIEAEDGGGVPIRLKVETNISEIEAYDPPIDLPFGVTNP